MRAICWRPIRALRLLFHIAMVVGLTALSQVGGVAWLASRMFHAPVLAFLLFYSTLSVASVWLAPIWGRIAISCGADGPLQVQTWVYCALNRTYVTPELADVLTDAAAEMDRRYPGTITVMLDGNFPYFDGFPLLPHRSHDDGEKADLAFYYADDTRYLPGAVRSPIGYFAFEPGPTACDRSWPTLRWDFDVLQPLWRDLSPDVDRNRAILRILASDRRVGRIFVEPHLIEAWSAAHPTIGFQGCRAARHDDHIHLQLR